MHPMPCSPDRAALSLCAMQGSLDDLSHVLANGGAAALDGATEAAALGLALPAVPKWRPGASPGWPGSPRGGANGGFSGSPRSAVGGGLNGLGSASGKTSARPSFEDSDGAPK